MVTPIFVFRPEHTAGLVSGTLQQVFSNGVPLSMVRDTVKGQIAGHAVGILSNGATLNPLVIAPQVAIGAYQMYQNHLGLQALQSLSASVATLQTTTAIIGVGTAVGVTLSAVNLWQTLKLRQEIGHLRLDIKDGFIDLKQALRDQGTEVLQRIEEVTRDARFETHRLVLIKAYGKFLEATKLIKIAISCGDASIRNADLAHARQMLAEALAAYNNPYLLEELSSIGRLRRLECAWAIEQAITITYQIQNELLAVSKHLSDLQAKVRQDVLSVITCLEYKDALDFLFPEITRIHDHDLVVLDSWQKHVDWMRSLPPENLKLLESPDTHSLEGSFASSLNEVGFAPGELPEDLSYENLKQKSHPSSLVLQLKFLMQPDVRRECETYVCQQAATAGHKALSPQNLQQASALAVANLFCYFKGREKSEELDEELANA